MSLRQNAYQLFKMGEGIGPVGESKPMAHVGKKASALDLESAEAMALQGLTFLAQEPARLLRFLKLTGLELQDARALAGTPELAIAVLEHLAQDESLLLVFAASCAVAPASIGLAISLLRSQGA